MKNEFQHKLQIIRSDRKSISLEISPDLHIVVRAPYTMSDKQIQQFIIKKAYWIEKHISIIIEKNREKQNKPKLQKITTEEIRLLGDKALEVIPKRVEYFAEQIGVTYGRITIRNQKTRWGSCSAKGNLNFNCLLMKTPPEVIDYVVVHELCHRKEMNHSPRFWAEVEKILPNYKEAKKWLKENGSEIILCMIEE